MPIIRIPTPLRRLTDDASTVTVIGADLRTALAELEALHPGLTTRILDDDGDLHRFVNVFVRDEEVRSLQGLDTPLGDRDTVAIVPAVAGGAD